MKALADRDNIHDLHIAQVRFGGDVFLEPGAKWTAEAKANDGKKQRERQEHESQKGGPCPSKREPGKGPGKKRSDGKVGATSWMNGESAFTGIQSGLGLCHCRPDILRVQISKQEKTGWVGVSCHALVGKFAREHVDGGVFERVVAPCFENKGKIEDHGLIIRQSVF